MYVCILYSNIYAYIYICVYICICIYIVDFEDFQSYTAWEREDVQDVQDIQDAQRNNPWAREYYQRDAIARGVEAARDEDIVLISDVDEIPKRAAVLLLRVCKGYKVPAFLAADMHYYGFHLAFADAWMQGPKVVLRSMLRGPVGATMIRRVLPLGSHGRIFNSSAWHCSYFVRLSDGSAGTQFTCFITTSTKAQMLTPEEVQSRCSGN